MLGSVAPPATKCVSAANSAIDFAASWPRSALRPTITIRGTPAAARRPGAGKADAGGAADDQRGGGVEVLGFGHIGSGISVRASSVMNPSW
jgi:hypothetical protein